MDNDDVMPDLQLHATSMDARTTSVMRRIQLLEDLARQEDALARHLAALGQRAYQAIRACRMVEGAAIEHANSLRRTITGSTSHGSRP
jgi:hypothetical protein